MTLFYLYRLKIERSEAPSIFDDQSSSPAEIIRSAVEEKPHHELRKRQTWRIGNVRQLSKKTLFFALGKVTKATHELYDETSGNFVEEALDEAPHTYVAIDLECQVCAIAKKLVSPHTLIILQKTSQNYLTHLKPPSFATSNLR